MNHLAFQEIVYTENTILYPPKKPRGKPSFPKGFPRSLPYLFINHHPTIPAFSIREVKELAAAIDNRLVERKAACFQDFQQVVRTGGAIAIGGLAQAVLAAGHTTDKAVQLVRSIAAQYGDRLAQTVAKRLQQPLDQPPDVGRGGGVGRVVETTRDGGLTVNKLVDREI